MGEVWKAVGTGAVTLVVGLVLLQLQLGGWRGKRRRELIEETQLLEQLEKTSDEGRDDELERIRARITVLLREYEPHPEAVKSEALGGTSIVAALALSVALLLQFVGVLPNPGTWEMFAIGGAVGTLGVVIDEVRLAAARRVLFRELVTVEVQQRAKRRRGTGWSGT